MSWIELAAVTNFSFLRGASHADEMVTAAKAMGYAALGVADRNTLAGVVRAHKAAKEAGLPLLVGARLVTTDGLEAIAYPRDRAAYGRLCRLLTLGNRRAPKGECWISSEDVIAHAEGLVFVVFGAEGVELEAPPPPTAGQVIVFPGRGGSEPAPQKTGSFQPPFGSPIPRFIAALPDRDSVFLALARAMGAEDLRRMLRVRTIAKQIGVRAVAVADPLFHTPQRRALADVLACIREHTTIDAAGALLQMNAERHLKPPEDLARLYKGFEAEIANQGAVLGQIRFTLDELRYEYPDEVVHPGETAMESLKRLTWEGAARRYPKGVPAKVRKAILHEFGLIEELDYAKYFLTVHEIVAYARAQDILCQGRGSAANSTVCYCLGITAVDPIKVDLLFERFVSAERREPPDIDVDFEHERREEVIQHIYEKYGRDRAGIAATVISYRGRSAIREVGKALGLSADTIDALSRTLWGWSEGGPRDEHVRDELGLDPNAPRLRLALDLAHELIGFPRHLSQHVGGFVITRGPLEEMVPIGNAAMEDRTFIEWDKDDIDALGILKIDLLALGMLTAVAKAFKMIEQSYGRKLCLATIPAEDPAVYDMICDADTIGVFQIESRAQMSMLPRLKPRCFYDLVIEVAIVRPGPIQGDMVHPYLRRRQGLEPVKFPSQELEDVLGKTLGVPLFQEQAMRIAIVAAGFTPGEADRLRRAMATFRKVGTIHTFREKLIEGMAARGYEREFAARCFAQIEGFGEYGFPESHAASFALIVYVSAWIKRYYPDVFLAALLNAQPMGFYAPAQLVRDAREHGVEVRAVDVTFSDWDNGLEGGHLPPLAGEVRRASARRDGGVAVSQPQSPLRAARTSPANAGEEEKSLHPIRLGFRQINGFSEADAAKIMAARASGVFVSVEDVRRRARLSARAMELLAHADAFRTLGADRRRALWETQALKGEELPLFSAASDFGPEEDPHLPVMPLAEHVAHDYTRLRLSLKAHPMAFFRKSCDRRRMARSDELATRPNGQRLELMGLVLVRQRPGSAKGVIFMTLEDEVGAANVIVWPDAFTRYRREVLGGRLLAITGRLQREGKVIHIIAERIVDWSQLLARLADGESFGEAGMARADEGRNPREDPRQAADDKAAAAAARRAAAGVLPKSRDFH